MPDLRSTGMHPAAPANQIEHLARCVSIVGHPYIVLPASVAAISVLRGDRLHAAAGLAALFIIISVAVLIGVRAGRFNDFDVSDRQRRPSFYVAVIAGTAALAVWLRDKPEAVGACVIAAAVLLVCGVINHWIKASLHSAFSLYAVGLWAAFSLSAGLVAVPLAAAVAWSRVRLRRHTLKEVLVGTAVGLIAAASFIVLARTGAPP